MLATLKERLRTSRSRSAATAVLIVVGIIAVVATPLVGTLTGHARLNAVAEASLDDALTKNALVFLGVSGIKAAMAVVEGSSVGVGFDVELGDLVQSAYDYVDFVWKVMLYGLTILGCYKLLLETGVLALGIKLAGVGLIAWGCARWIPKRKRTLRLVGRRCLLLGLLFAYVVPLALLGTQFLSTTYTQPLKAKQNKEIIAVRQKLDRLRADFTRMRDKVSLTSPSESLGHIKMGLMRSTRSMTDLLGKSTLVFIHYLAILFFELLLFPFLSALFLYKTAQFALVRVLEPAPAQPPAKQQPQSC